MYDHSLDRVKEMVVLVRLRFPSETVGKNGFGNGVSCVYPAFLVCLIG